MKKLLALALLTISLIACKKKEPEPETETSPAPTASVPDKTISVICKTSCQGTLNVCWDLKWNTFVADSTYTYTNNTFTKTSKGDSMYVHFVSTIPTILVCPSDVTVTVNGTAIATYTNNQTSLYYYLKL